MKKWIIRITVGTLTLSIVLFAALVLHLYMVMPQNTNSDLRVRQLSRIDFSQEIDSAEAEKIRGFVQSLDGVQSTHFNTENGALVYTYAVGKQTSDNVYNQLMLFGNYKAQKYVVSAQQAQQGCPAHIEESSFSKSIAGIVAHLFN